MDQRPNNYNDQGSNGQEPNGNGGPGGPKNKSSLLVLLICVLATLLIWTVFSNILQSSTSKEITYDKFLEMLDKGEVKSVELQSGVLTIVPREQKVEGVEFEYSTTAMEDGTTLTARLLEAEQKTGKEITFNEIQPGSDRIDHLYDFKSADTVCISDFPDELADEKDEQRRRNDGRRKEQSQSLCTERNRCYVQGCSR